MNSRDSSTPLSEAGVEAEVLALEGYLLRSSLKAKADLAAVGHDANGSPETQFAGGQLLREG